MKKVIIPICCLCLTALLGLGLWHSDFFDNTQPNELEDSTIVSEKDYIEPDTSSQTDNLGDVIGMVKYNDAYYVQCNTTDTTNANESITPYTPGEYLGEVCDFEGTYQRYPSEVACGLYISKEDPNVLMVELNNGEEAYYVFLMKEQNN